MCQVCDIREKIEKHRAYMRHPSIMGNSPRRLSALLTYETLLNKYYTILSAVDEQISKGLEETNELWSEAVDLIVDNISDEDIDTVVEAILKNSN